jgi:L-lactate utilization protein LutC
LRFIELPSTDASEIKNMVEFQAFKETPYAKDEIITSYKNLGSYKKGFSCIMLAIVKKEIIENMIQQAKDEIEDIRLETELLYSFLLQKGIIKSDKVSLAINIKKEYAEIVITDKTKLIFSRSIKNRADLMKELANSMLFYNRDKANNAINDVNVTYSKEIDVKDIKLQIEDYFKTPVNFCEYSDDLVSMDIPLHISFLPKEYNDKMANKENKKELLLTSCLVFIAIAALSTLLIFKLHEKDKTLNLLSSHMSSIQHDVDQLRDFLRKAEILKSQKQKGDLVINVLKGSYDLTPSDIFLYRLEYDGRYDFSYKGTVSNASDVFNFVKALEKSKYFKNVEVKYTTKKVVQNQEVTDFNILCQID